MTPSICVEKISLRRKRIKVYEASIKWLKKYAFIFIKINPQDLELDYKMHVLQ